MKHSLYILTLLLLCDSPVFADDKVPHVVLVAGTHHYAPQTTLPKLAERLEQYGFRTTVVRPKEDPEGNPLGLAGLQSLESADVAIFYLRFLTLPQEQFDHIHRYVTSGKPIIGIRTSTHAFDYPANHPLFHWNDDFGSRVLGSKYYFHLAGSTEVSIESENRDHPLLNGIAGRFYDPGTLYKTELPEDAQALLKGTGRAKRTGKVTNRFGTHQIDAEMSFPVAWTWKNEWGGDVFTTTLGHQDSFDLPHVNRLFVNAVHWALNRPVDVSSGKALKGRNYKNLQRPVGKLGLHDPQLELESFKLLPGFKANIWAAEPMLVNPIHMTWDPQGRLWVCFSPNYPQVRPGERPNDMIVVLEDTNNDGQADKSTVFADGLYVPTGLELGDGGVYVANAPDLLFLKDTDGDLKADIRQTVLTGFATEDNHHSISAWRWGPGGWLYFQEGTFMHTQVETPHGVVRLENGGVYQFRPRDLDLRIYMDYRASNPWGHMFDAWGEGVLIDNPKLYFTAPLTANSRAKLSYDGSKGSTKQCGGEFVSGRHLPEEYHGQIWTNQYKAHQIARYQPQPDGSGWSYKELDPLLTSDNGSFRPVDLKMGPDGAVYVLDWYNPLIGHMQHSFRDERRDTTHGRVWRITHEASPLVEAPQLTDRPLPEIVSHLSSPESWTRHQVKRVLYDADVSEASEALREFAHKTDRVSANEHLLLEVLWSYQTIGVQNLELLKELLAAKDYRTRTAALRVMRYWHQDMEDPLAWLDKAVRDEHPRVRLEAVLTLGFIPHPKSVIVAVRALDYPMDYYLEHALKLTVDGLQKYWLPTYRRGDLRFDSVEHENYALSNLLSNESVQALINILNSGNVDTNRLQTPLRTIAERATAKQLEKLVLTLTEHTREYNTRGREATDPKALALVLAAFDEAARTRKVRPNGMDQLIPRCLAIPHSELKTAAVRLIGSNKLLKQHSHLKRLITNQSEPIEVRVAAAQSLGELGRPPERDFLRNQTAPKQPMIQRYLGVVGLAAADIDLAAETAANVLHDAPKETDPAVVLDAFLTRKNGANTLAAALSKTPPHEQTRQLLIDRLIRTGLQPPKLIEALGGDVGKGTLEDLLVREDAKQLAAEAESQGDPHRGELIFRRTNTACQSCHAISGAGSAIGPDLGTIGSSSPTDYIVDSLLKPSKVIKEFYETVIVLTDEGRLVTGILVTSDEEKVVLKDPQKAGQEITIPVEHIEATKKGPSLMPKGLVNKLESRQEFLDLVRFISVLGKPGDFASSVKPVIREWHIASIPASSASKEKVVYCKVDGNLPPEVWSNEEPSTIRLTTDIHATQEGRVELLVNSLDKVKVFYADEKVELGRSNVIQLNKGIYPLHLLVDPARTEAIRVELREIPGSNAEFRLSHQRLTKP